MNFIQKTPAKKTSALLEKIFLKQRIERVLLVNPPDGESALFQLDTAKRGRYTNYPPYGLLIVAQWLRTISIEVEICNLNNEILKQSRCRQTDQFKFEEIWRSKLVDQIEQFKPDLVGVTCMFTMTHGSLKSVCDLAHEMNVPIAIGGVHISNDVDRIMNDVHSASFAFLRESEIAFQTFVKVVNKEIDVDQLHQVVIKDANKLLRFDQSHIPQSDEIDILPAYDLIDISEYSDHGAIGGFYCFKPEDTKFATVQSNRGCRAQCTFCSVRNFNGPGVRQKSISLIIDELDMLVNEYGIGHFIWLDDDLFKDHRRAVNLFDAMTSRNLPLTWDATNGVIASSCTEEVIHAASESGCLALNIGVESGNPEILKKVRKPGTVETFLKAAEVLRRFENIHSSVFLMIGFPGETLSMIMDTIELVREMNLDWCRISQLQPLPNTPIYDSMIAQGLVQEIGSKELRFNGGPYGKQPVIEQGFHLSSPNFAEAFSSISLDAIPSPEQLTDIWFFMNYHLNFGRIFREQNPTKIAQLVAHLNVLADVISPENGFALYFLAYLEHRKNGALHSNILDRLRSRLETSSFWSDRLSAFKLSIDDFEHGYFPASETMLEEMLSAKGKINQKNIAAYVHTQQTHQ